MGPGVAGRGPGVRPIICCAAAFSALTVSLPSLAAQDGPRPWVAFQAYPAGLIPAVGGTLAFDRTDIDAHLGVNLTNRRDFGEHDHESGHGFGGGVSVHRRLGVSPWSIGLRVDLWSMDIAWRDREPGPARMGTTDITVLQPTAHLRRTWTPTRRFAFFTTAALGMEFNVHTRGEPVGDGPILLLGVGLKWRGRP